MIDGAVVPGDASLAARMTAGYHGAFPDAPGHRALPG